jgi:hypothetical protein
MRGRLERATSRKRAIRRSIRSNRSRTRWCLLWVTMPEHTQLGAILEPATRPVVSGAAHRAREHSLKLEIATVDKREELRGSRQHTGRLRRAADDTGHAGLPPRDHSADPHHLVSPRLDDRSVQGPSGEMSARRRRPHRRVLATTINPRPPGSPSGDPGDDSVVCNVYFRPTLYIR